MEIVLEPKRITRFFGAIAILLALAHLAAQFSIYGLGYENDSGLIPMFVLNAEGNIPALYATISLLFCSILLAIISTAKKKAGGRYFLHWAGLAAIFLFLSLDEALSFHESTTIPLRRALDTSGILFYAWIIPYGLALILLFVAYLKFFLHLPKKTLRLFILAAVLYLTGVMAFEVMGGIYDENFGRHNPVYAIISTFEELFEMGGVLMFIYALTAYISVEFPNLAFRISSKESPALAESTRAGGESNQKLPVGEME